MSFTIAYDIKAVDKFSDVADKVYNSMARMDRSMRKVASASNKTTAALQRTGAVASANGRKMSKAFDKAGRSAIKNKQKVQRFNTALSGAGQGLKSVGSTASRYVSLPLAAAGVASMKFAMDFETAMVEVQKVTDKTTADKLTLSIRKMSREIPVLNTALAGIAADAARFGVRGSENIEKFTRAVAMMATATDLTTDQAGVAFAKIQVQTGLTAATTENLGSSINELANNYATSSSEIVAAMLRSSSAASNFGLSATQIAGLSAQMNAMSEGAERAGTRMRSLFNELQDPDKVERYAKAIGMSADQFDQVRAKSPVNALMLFVDAMNKNGDAAKRLRSELSGESTQALVALGKNVDDTRSAVDLAGKAFLANTSLQREFDAANKTAAARFKLVANKARDLGITVGEKLLPLLERLLDQYIVPLIEKLAGMDDATLESTLKMAAFAMALGPVLSGLGNVATAVSGAMTLFSNLKTVMSGAASIAMRLPSAFNAIGKAAKANSSKVRMMGVAFAAVTAAMLAYQAIKNDIEASEKRLSKTEQLREKARIAAQKGGKGASMKDQEAALATISKLRAEAMKDIKAPMTVTETIAHGLGNKSALEAKAGTHKHLLGVEDRMRRQIMQAKHSEKMEEIMASAPAGFVMPGSESSAPGGVPSQALASSSEQSVKVEVELIAPEGVVGGIKQKSTGGHAKVNVGKNTRE